MITKPVVMLPLASFVAVSGRLCAANILGCTGPALANAIRAGRTIFVEVAGDGSAIAFEISKFPGR